MKSKRIGVTDIFNIRELRIVLKGLLFMKDEQARYSDDEEQELLIMIGMLQRLINKADNE